MNNKEIILNKIKKLLALSKSSNIHEAELALQKAKELMKEYNINYQEEDFYESLLRKTSNWWIQMVASIISGYYGSKAVLDKKKGITIIGEELEVKLSCYAISVIIRIMNRMINEYKKNTKYITKNKINSYIRGMLISLHEKFSIQNKEKIEKVKKYISDRYKLKEVHCGKNISASNNDCINEGYHDGQKIKINPGVNTGFKNELLLEEKL